MASGLSNKEIAWQMKISEHTVKSHVASIFAKLEVSTRTEAVTQGIRKGLIMMSGNCLWNPRVCSRPVCSEVQSATHCREKS